MFPAQEQAISYRIFILSLITLRGGGVNFQGCIIAECKLYRNLICKLNFSKYVESIREAAKKPSLSGH